MRKKRLKTIRITNAFTIPKYINQALKKIAFLLMEFIDSKIPSDDFWISFW